MTNLISKTMVTEEGGAKGAVEEVKVEGAAEEIEAEKVAEVGNAEGTEEVVNHDALVGVSNTVDDQKDNGGRGSRDRRRMTSG